MKWKTKYSTVRTIPKLNIKIVEKRKMDTSNNKYMTTHFPVHNICYQFKKNKILQLEVELSRERGLGSQFNPCHIFVSVPGLAFPKTYVVIFSGFIHFFVEQNQGLFKDFPGQKLQFSSTFFWAFSYIKHWLTLPFFKWKCLYPAQALVSGNIVSRYIFLPETSACGT